MVARLGDGRLAPFFDESKPLGSQLSMLQRLGKAGPNFIGNGTGNLSRSSQQKPLGFLPGNAPPLTLFLSLLWVGVATAVLFLVDRLLPLNLVPIVYLIPVTIAATRWGIWPAIAAAIAGAAAADFFFFPPFYSFRIDDPQEIIDLLLFLLVAFVSGDLASRLRRETERLRQREHEIQYLFEFSRRLAVCFTVPDLISAIQNYLADSLGEHTVFFFAALDEDLRPSHTGAVPEMVERRAAAMIGQTGFRAETIIDAPTNDVWLLRAVSSEEATHGVIAANIGSGSRAVIDGKTRRVEAILAEASLTLQSLDIGKAMEEAELRLKAQFLRDAFHDNLSHELRSPLAAIRGSASVLASVPAIRHDHRMHSLVEAITDEVERLDGFTRNLLNATRVSANDVRPHLECADPRDIVNAAIRRRSRQLKAHDVKIRFAEDLPFINVDSALVEEACGQLLENAAKYSASGSTISISTRSESGQVICSVSDQGVGITPDEQRELGRRSFRGQRHQATIPGSGLGFWIASTFVRANGGTIGVSSRGQGQGTTASITLPGSDANTSELAVLTDE
jgi:K+-sensing histidine kinase KdpD